MKSSLHKIGKTTKQVAYKVLGINDELSKLSPVPHLLLSNAPPNETEISLILSAIDQAKRDLAIFERQVTGGSKKRRLVCSEFIRIHESILSPLRRTPVDILTEIFIQAAYSELGLYSTPPWSISQVCHQWRSIALDLPLLWNCINIQLNEDHKTHAFLQSLAMRLNRSREAPLDIFISSAMVGFEYIQHPIVGHLVEHAERWRSVHLTMSGRTLQAFGGIKGRLPRLRLLNLVLYGPFPEAVIDTFEISPQLREVRNLGYLPSSTALVLPRAQIITYRGVLGNRTLWESILTQSTSLQRLDLTFPRNATHVFPVFPFARLEAVISFTLNFDELGSWDPLPEDFLEGLTLPCVEHIKLTNYYGAGLLELKSLITRSHASLKKLEFSSLSGTLSPELLISILHLSPQLTNLETLTLPLPVLRSLIINSDQPTIVPSLRTLTLHPDYRIVGYDFEKVMASLVASRCEPRKATTDDISQKLSVRLCFRDDVQKCYLTQELLESVYRVSTYVRPPSKIEETQFCLANYSMQLANELPYIENHIAMAQVKQPTRSIFKPTRGLTNVSILDLVQIFNDISNHNITDVSDIYNSSIHHLLFHIVQIINDANVDHDAVAQSWYQNATSILHEWNTRFVIPDLPNRRWAFDGFDSIAYTPVTHEMRQDVESALKMIYGTSINLR